MHEAGIAQAIAAEIRERALDPAAIRIVVSGGHGDEESFDAALRTHLEAAAPELGLGRLAIVHAAVARICTRCATPFEASLAADPCPACGGPGIAVPVPERVELEWLDESGGEGPSSGPARAEVREEPHDGRHEHEIAEHPRARDADTRDADPRDAGGPAHDGPHRPPPDDGRHSR